ncbi:nucleotide pyrophosphohydrolase [Staphylococcus sp. SQ8-PEA]|uniref:Nucleotide pyrophosphohydrolase n=1 Tax=Staphylococcus marylandisciuri TaxID=2981529 RepID=A0ABT2QND2_9STAP|nr:nucleotide pyrophosphohydrolase [Staphylococcus marylandisciuri]MCU5745491.1 nucleotide pyrophosphohydrolase [Staphylococcus marylandisciuri]
MKSMYDMQREVDQYINQFKAGYFSPLANLARLTEEVGELSREINHYYGEKKKKQTEADNTIEAELGDNLFVLLCIANSLDIDMTQSFDKTMHKFNTRDKDRFEKRSRDKSV